MNSWTIVDYNGVKLTLPESEPEAATFLLVMAELVWHHMEATKEETDMRLMNLLLYGTTHPEIYE